MIVIFVVVCGVMAVAVGASYITVPDHNSEATHFDVLIVLGAPPDPDGKPSSEEVERVEEAIREFRAGRSEHLIMTGGAVTSLQPEAEVMAGIARKAGVPAASILVEPRSRNTIENIYFSNQLMRQKKWSAAEVVSSPSHVRRAALLLQHYALVWRTKSAPWPPEFTWQRIGRYYLREVPGTVALRWFGFRYSPFIPQQATVWTHGQRQSQVRPL